MDIDLDELYCDRSTLLQILAALKAIRPSRFRLESRYGALSIQANNSERKYSTRGCTDCVTVHIPYGGEEDGGFSNPKELIRSLQNTEEAEVLPVPTTAKPLGWDDDFPKLGARQGKPYDGPGLHHALNFLLRLDPFSGQRMEFGGILLKGSEMLVTDRYTMHIHQGLPSLRKEDIWLWGGDSAACLHRLMRVLPVSSLEYHVNGDTLFFILKDELGIEAVVSSTFRLRTDPDPTPFTTRLAVSEYSLGFAIHTEFLVSMLQATIDASKGAPAVTLRTEQGKMLYAAFDRTETGLRDIYQGDIPMSRSLQGQGDIEVTLDANKLKDATAGLGDITQLIIPCHPQFGFEFYPIFPVYVNCNPAQFAVIMPVVTNPDYALDLRRKYKEAHAQ